MAGLLKATEDAECTGVQWRASGSHCVHCKMQTIFARKLEIYLERYLERLERLAQIALMLMLFGAV